MQINHYKSLGVNTNASSEEIKCAYRELVKVHHPDAGGDEQTILLINAAWEILGDSEKRRDYDLSINKQSSNSNEAYYRGVRNAKATDDANTVQSKSATEDKDLYKWIKEVYEPIDKQLGMIINPFTSQIKELSADPYDDILMANFCTYLTKCIKKINKVEEIYRSIQAPKSAYNFSISLYQCLAQVKDAINEIEIYTMGYVDNYLHDGLEMLREAKKKRLTLKKQRITLKI